MICVLLKLLEFLLNLNSLPSDFSRPFSPPGRSRGKNLSAHFVVECSLTIFGRSRDVTKRENGESGIGNRKGEWGMGSGEWGVGSGEWGVGSGEWGMGNGEWKIRNGEWGMGDGRWEMGDGRWGMRNSGQR